MEAGGGGGQLFSVDPLERQAARGHGVVTSMAAGSDVIVLGTSRGWLVRHDFSFEDAHDLDLGSGRSGDHSVHRVFLDPGGKHCVVTVVHPGGAELTEQREGIKDLQMETAVVGNSTRYYVMAVTPTRLYSFTGIGSLECSATHDYRHLNSRVFVIQRTWRKQHKIREK